MAALGEVPGLLQDRAVRTRIPGAFSSAYREIARRISLLRLYKGLHDRLHVIQLLYTEISRAAKCLAQDGSEAGSLRSYADQLNDTLQGDRTTPSVDVLIDGLANRDPGISGMALRA